jgi:hypothetical protein
MRSFKPFFLYVVALAFAALGTPTAWAGEIDLTSTPGPAPNGFGNSFLTPGPSAFLNGAFGFDANVTVYQCTTVTGCGPDTSLAAANNGVFSYLYTITNAGSVEISQVSIGGPFNSLLNYGFVGPAATHGSFAFSTSSLLVNTCVGSPNCISTIPNNGNSLMFYGQTFFSPTVVNISGQGGGTSASGAYIGPSPEPGSIALFGSGLVLLGGVIRRRLRRKVS